MLPVTSQPHLFAKTHSLMLNAAQDCASWRYDALDWRAFLVLLESCTVQGRQQQQGAFQHVLGTCIVPQSRSALCTHAEFGWWRPGANRDREGAAMGRACASHGAVNTMQCSLLVVWCGAQPALCWHDISRCLCHIVEGHCNVSAPVLSCGAAHRDPQLAIAMLQTLDRLAATSSA